MFLAHPSRGPSRCRGLAWASRAAVVYRSPLHRRLPRAWRPHEQPLCLFFWEASYEHYLVVNGRSCIKSISKRKSRGAGSSRAILNPSGSCRVSHFDTDATSQCGHVEMDFDDVDIGQPFKIPDLWAPSQLHSRELPDRGLLFSQLLFDSQCTIPGHRSLANLAQILTHLFQMFRNQRIPMTISSKFLD